MRLFRSSEILGIATDTLDFVLEACANTHPNEFMGLLRATDASKLDLGRKGSVITEVLVIPGTKSGHSMATLREDMVPVGSGSVGTVHSHPSGSTRPSGEDLSTFGRKGKRHIIVGHPYTEGSWTCYNGDGDVVELDVLDVALDDMPLEWLGEDDSHDTEPGDDRE
ncbi:MAG: Mov34/MPN/PAD-1 family protein [Halobacteria archaeon]|nr:Mov34/MPN/PAD-1 family protein [Halobacteria archaeon]